MSFFDDLKKPCIPQPVASSDPPAVMVPESRQLVALQICNDFKNKCTKARHDGYTGKLESYTWIDEWTYVRHFTVSDDNCGRQFYYHAIDRNEAMKLGMYLTSGKKEIKYGRPRNLDAPNPMSYEETNAILALVNELFVKDGFPPNTATLAKMEITEHTGFFSSVRYDLYFIDVRADWG